MALGTPYVSKDMLLNAPSGASWEIIPRPNAPQADVDAALIDIAWRATSDVDTYCNQVLRSTADTEYLTGPGQPRCGIDRDNGAGVLVMRRWPVTSVLAIQTSPARSFPRVWTPVPAGQWDIRHPLIYSGDSASATAPDGGWTIDVAPGYIKGRRSSLRVQVCYENGWPHTSLTAASTGSAGTLAVDDVTGWAGASGFAYDGSATEQLSVESVAANTLLALPDGAGYALAGPGVITLSSPLTYGHGKGTIISALPATVMEATILAATAQALEGGIDALTVQALPGEHSSSGDGGTADVISQYKTLLNKFMRVM